jgi:hypothetical protein
MRSMKYRYFYAEDGHIVGTAQSVSRIFATAMNKSVGYIDSDQSVSVEQYCVDPKTKTLVPKQSE